MLGLFHVKFCAGAVRAAQKRLQQITDEMFRWLKGIIYKSEYY